MTPLASRRRPGRLPRVTLAAGLVVALAAGTRLLAPGAGSGPVGLDEPLIAAAPAADPVVAPAADPGGGTTGVAAADLARIRADLDFWAARLEANPGDIVAAVELAFLHVADARATGDVTAYLRAETAADLALAAQPHYGPALAAKGTVLVALHRFADARDVALAALDRAPGDATALGVLGDASLELGDLPAARDAYTALATVADGSAARIRAGRLAFVEGDPAAALAATGSALDAARDEGLESTPLAFLHVTLGELRRAAGDAAGARTAYEAALDARPGDPAALVGLARLDAFEGDLDAAVHGLDIAIASIPAPDWLALRSDLLDQRGAPGDTDAAAADRATVEAIATLAGGAAGVYDRGHALYLADHGLDPARAVALAEAEVETRRDVYGWDALAWALLAAGRPADAAAPMATALSGGTQDARLWYHAGLVASASGDAEAARAFLSDALALGPALDPAARDRAAAALDALP